MGEDASKEARARTEPLRGADVINPRDPAFGHIAAVGARLRAAGLDPSNPVVAELARRLGRIEHEEDARTQAKRSVARSAQRKHGDMPEQSVVYYMRIGNRVKIGWSSNLPQRLAVINPEELLATEPGGREVEALRHGQFAGLRTHGEWFRFESPLVDHVRGLRSVTSATS